MGIKFGEIDSSQILDNEFKLRVLEQLFDWLLGHNPDLHRPSKDDITKIRDKIIEDLKKKYPNSGIHYKEG